MSTTEAFTGDLPVTVAVVVEGRLTAMTECRRTLRMWLQYDTARILKLAPHSTNQRRSQAARGAARKVSQASVITVQASSSSCHCSFLLDLFYRRFSSALL